MAKAEEDKTLGFRCPTELRDGLDKVATKGDRTRSAQILRYVREGLVRDGAITLADALKASA